MKKIRRNSVVFPKDKGRAFYGRVIRSLPNDEFLWLDSGLYFHISHRDDLELSDYKGYTDYRGHFIPMTSLRNLKRMARKYHHEAAFNTPLDYEFIKRKDRGN